MDSDPILAALQVIRVLEALEVPYYVAGSLASSGYGLPRATNDADLVADLQPEHASKLAAALGEEFYADEQMIREAIERHGSFNLIFLETMDKVDVFVPERSEWGRVQMQRRRPFPLDPAQPGQVPYFASAEDTVLNKLIWYRMGGEVSDRQWGDVTGVLKVQRDVLDLAYLRYWAADLRVTDLLARAFSDAGLTDG